jgi:hypothetical protein
MLVLPMIRSPSPIIFGMFVLALHLGVTAHPLWSSALQRRNWSRRTMGFLAFRYEHQEPGKKGIPVYFRVPAGPRGDNWSIA